MLELWSFLQLLCLLQLWVSVGDDLIGEVVSFASRGNCSRNYMTNNEYLIALNKIFDAFPLQNLINCTLPLG